ncbi:hypothetical protein Back11_52510 [Paenibacillus baekrokdamisoli]|uniref:Uncharacterized protein n=1 Tax=Paenibacillus baekrokdamisoli TaxID=1712516 RepID=A0A3G9IZB1_9BACL|nr:DUF6470 family protein [Paenibacillus baekrokdamisoli]MBB3069092.1 hypothetical protein [Paenibacillus baekrokdamisoli]BBH23906.1 hypothetical protein Back11_52510 [Paenibacillus baekrokdamisoli]
MEFLRLSIHQTNAQIGIQTQLAGQDIHSRAGDLSIQQPPAKVEMESPAGELEIDSSEAWAALGKGPHLEWLNSIYSQSKSVALQAIAKMVEDGNRMAQITNHQNAFADLAQDVYQRKNPIEYAGEPSYFNVKVHYQSHSPIINIEPQKAEIQYSPNKPEVQYNPGSVDVYVKQKNAIDIQVSQYDWYK